MIATSRSSVRRSALRAACVGAGGLLAFLVLDLGGLPASAATQIEQASVPLTSVSSTSPVSLAQFDPADGTLQQVTVTVSVAASTDVTVTNLTPAAKSTTVSIESTASVAGPGVTTLAVSPTGSQSQNLASGATFAFGVDASGSQQQVITAPADLAAFVGAGNVTFNLTGLVGVDVQGPATWRGSGSFDATATVQIEYQFNQAPVAVADTTTVAEDSGASAIDVLSNDTDADGGAIAIGAVSQPANGTVVITGGGSGLTYEPDPNYCNNPPGTTPDTFTYTLAPGSSTATVSVTVTCVDDAPVAFADTATTTEDAAAPLPIDVLANDTDIDGGPMAIASASDPANGTVVLTGGSPGAHTGLTYQPDPNYCNDPPGTTLDTFTYTLNGGSTATVSVSVTCVDDPPVAVNDAVTVSEDAAATPLAVLANDSDDNLGSMTISSASDPANGTVVLTGGSTGAHTGLTYQPDPNYCNNPPGTTLDTFTYTLNGGSTATVSVTVTCGDDAPVAVNDAATVGEDSAASAIDVLANDTDIDAGPKTIASASDPANGTVVLTGGSAGAHTGLTYQPDPNYCNSPPGMTPDTFTYTLTPGSSSATVSVTVTCVDDGPTAAGDTATVAEDSAASAIDVLANDTDLDGGPMAIASASDPANGTVVLTGGSAGAHTGLTYQPDPNYCNDPPGTTPDTFTYTLNGGSTATVSVTVTCVDDPPTAVDDAVTVSEDAAATAVAVLANDSDDGLGSVTLSSASDPANGTVVLTGGSPGAFTGLTYQPDPNYCNDPPGTTPDTFTYTINGGSTATVLVTVTCVDDAPVAVDDAATVGEDSGASAIDVLGNDTDVDAGPRTIASASDPANGTVVLTGGSPGAFTGLTYQPDPNYCNDPPGTTPDTFTYTINGGSTATVSVTVTCVDDAPVAVDDAATVGEDPGASAIDVLGNDTDVDAGPRTIASASDPANGTVVLTGGSPGAFTGLTYQPDPNYCNDPPGTTPDTFTYTINGGSTATVLVTVTCVDDAPVAVNDAATVGEDSGASAIDVLGNDTDVDAGPRTIASASDPANGTVVLTGGSPGAFTGLTYQPDPNYCNDPPGTTPDTFTYTLNGGSTAPVIVTVTCVNDPPSIIAPATASVERDVESATAGISVADPDAGDIELTLAVDNGTIDVDETASTAVVTGDGTDTVVITGSVAEIIAILAATDGVVYLNDAGFAGLTDSLHLDIDDLGTPALTASATVTLQFNQPPVAVDGSDTTNEDTTKTLTLTGTDADDDLLTFTVPATTAQGGTLSNAQAVNCSAVNSCTRQIDYTPALNFNGSDSFTFTVSDGQNSSPPATFTITVNAVNDAPTVTTSFGTTTFTEDGPPVVVDAGVVVSDVDSPTLSSATVTITGLGDGASETLDATLSGGVTTKNFAAGVLTLSGTATVAEYQTVLRTVVYNNSDQDPTPGGGRSIGFAVNDGTLTSATASKSLNVVAVNDAPVVTAGAGSVSYTEDGAPVAIAPALTVADVDGPNLVAGTVTITGNPAAGDVLAFTPAFGITDTNTAPDVLALSGTTTLANWQTVLRSVTYSTTSDNPSTLDRTISFQVYDGAAANNLSNIATRTVTIIAVNDAPVITLSGSTPSYTENGPEVTVDGALSVTDADDTNLESGTVSITGGVVAGDTLTFTPAAGITDTNAAADVLALTGTATVAQWQSVLQSVQYSSTSDNPTNATRVVTFVVNDGPLNSNSAPKNVTVVPVNDAPVLTQPDAGALSYTENAAATAIAPNITAADVDSTNLVGATITIGTGYINGQDVLSLGTNPQNGITAGAFNAATGTITLSGSATVANYQTALRDVRYANTSDNPTPDPRTISFQVNDGGVVNNLSNIVSRTVTVLPVNDAPTAGADSFDTIGNTELRVDLAAGSTPTVTETTAGANGVRGNDADHPAENNPFTVTSIVGCADGTAPYDCIVAGGTVSMTADGDFSFVPSPTLASGAPTDTTFQYVITDQPAVGFGAPATATGTVTIHVYDKVWYVRQGATGNGTSTSPLGSFTGIAAGDASDSDAPGDYIFVHHTGTTLNSAITLEANQHLLGEGVGLSINRTLNGNGAPTNLVAAGTRPQVTSAAADTITIGAAIPAEVRGLSLASTLASNGNAIVLTSSVALSGSPSLTISDNTLTGATAEGIDVNLNAGTTGTLALSITNNTWSGTAANHAGNAVDINRAAGTLNLAFSTNTNILSNASGVVVSGGGAITITGFSNNSVSGDTAGAGMSISNVVFDATPGGAVQAIDADTLAIGTVANPVGGSGLAIVTSTGSIAFDDLDVFSATGTALNVTSPGPVTALSFSVAPVAPVGAGTTTILAQNGPALTLTNVTADLRLADLDSTTTSSAVGLNTVAGQFSAPSGSTISKTSGAGGPAFSVAGSSAAVSYAGTINVTSGSGISLTTNTGTIGFTGQITLTTAGSAAFVATGGGTVTATGSGSTLTTTTGTALNVANTTIGAADLSFLSIAANGAANGILLNNTGAVGNLVVTGSGSTAQGGDFSGGTIQNTTGFGISLTNTTAPSFRNMRLLNTGDSGVNGTQVTGFSFVDGTITGAGDASDENSITFDDSLTSAPNLTGAVTITNNVISQTEAEGIDIENWAGTITTAIISNNALSDTGDVATPGSAITLIGSGLATSAASIDRATIANNTIVDFRAGAGIQVRTGNPNAGAPVGHAGTAGSATDIITITGNSMNGGSGGIGNQPDRFFTGGVSGNGGQGNFNISNNGTAANRLRNIDCIAIEVQMDGPVTMTSTVSNNFINANSAVGCAGIAVGTDDPNNLGAGTHTTVISGNNVMGTDGPGIFPIVRDSGSTMTARVINNVVAAPIATNAARAGIRVDSGSSEGDTTMCLEISGNTTAGSTNSGTATISPGINLRKQGTDPTINTFGIEGLSPSPTGTPNVENHVNSLNTSTSGTFGVGGTALLSAQTGFTSCNAP